MADTAHPLSTTSAKKEPGFVRALGLFDGTMIVVGSMIGSGIFIVAADISRQTGSPGGLILTWILTGLLTISAALSYGELAALFPHAGGQYVYLREAYSPLWGFLYGWTLFLVIQTGTIAAVAVGFARYLGVLWPKVGESEYLISPKHVQNTFTTAKLAALFGLIVLGIFVGWNSGVVHANFGNLWTVRGSLEDLGGGLTAVSAFGLFVGVCVAQTGSLFSAD